MPCFSVPKPYGVACAEATSTVDLAMSAALCSGALFSGTGRSTGPDISASLRVLDRRRDQLDLLIGQLLRPFRAERLVHDLVVQLQHRVDEHLRTRRAAGEVHVDGYDMVDALDDRVVVEHPARGRAHAHRQHPP